MALPFINKISQFMSGISAPSCNGAATQTATSTGTVTITIANTSTTPSTGGTPFNTSGMPAPSRGWWHLRISNATATATVTVEVRVSDGTNIWSVQPPVGAYTLATGYLDLCDQFNTDVNITSVIFIVVVGGTATSVPIDVEISLI